jgi:PhnB protein
MHVPTYLQFDGRCEEAFEFYRGALGAESIMLMRFKDAPAGGPSNEGCAGGPAPDGNKIMHMAFRIGETMILASDGHCQGQPSFQGFSLALQPSDTAEAERLFSALAEGGQVQMPLTETFFSPRFGMVADRFGISWMIVVAAQGPIEAPARAGEAEKAGA